jgi:hypothetical protein
MAFSGIMGAIGLIGMLANTVNAGAQSTKNMPGIQEAIVNIKKQSAGIKAQFTEAIKGDAQNNLNAQNAIDSSNKSILQSQAMLKEALETNKIVVRKIQIGGVVFLGWLFFMLLLERVGVIKAIQKLL